MRFAVVVLAAWTALGLFGHDPWKPDEAYTFGLVYHILQNGDWLVPTLGGLPFVEKPPLFFWTAAVFAKAFGWALPLHDAARLASALYVPIALWFTYLASGPKSERRIAAPLLLAACLGYLQHAHQLLTDNALVAGVAMALYGLASSNPLALGTGAGIAFLSKGLIGPGVLGLSAVLLVAFPDWRRSWRGWPLAIAAFAPWALVWPWLLYRQSPALFHEWFWVNNFGRFTGSAGLGGVYDHAHYAKALAWFALPAWPLAFWQIYREGWSRRNQVPLLAFLVMFFVLSAASSARTLYGLPMLVPLALLAAFALEAAPAWITRPLNALAVEGCAVLALALWLAWIAFLFGWHPAFLEAASPGFDPAFQPLAFVAAVAMSVLWVYAQRREPRLAMRWVAGIALVWGLAMTLWLPWLDHAKSYRGVIADMRGHMGPGCVATEGLTEPQRAMFHYYAGIEAPSRASCPLLVVHTASARAPAPGDGWKLAWHGTRPGDTKEFFWLYRRDAG